MPISSFFKLILQLYWFIPEEHQILTWQSKEIHAFKKLNSVNCNSQFAIKPVEDISLSNYGSTVNVSPDFFFPLTIPFTQPILILISIGGFSISTGLTSFMQLFPFPVAGPPAMRTHRFLLPNFIKLKSGSMELGNRWKYEAVGGSSDKIILFGFKRVLLKPFSNQWIWDVH